MSRAHYAISVSSTRAISNPNVLAATIYVLPSVLRARCPRYVLDRAQSAPSHTGCSYNANFSSSTRFCAEKKTERACSSVKRTKPAIECENASESCMLARHKTVYWSTCSLGFLCRPRCGTRLFFCGRAAGPDQPAEATNDSQILAAGKIEEAVRELRLISFGLCCHPGNVLAPFNVLAPCAKYY